MSFFERFLTTVKFFQKLGHLATKIVCLKIFEKPQGDRENLR